MPDTQQSGPSSQLASVLAGGPSPQAAPQSQQIPNTASLPVTPSANASAPVSSAPPPSPGQSSVWKDLALGALWGLTGAARSGAMSGRGGSAGDQFAAGVAGGAAGVLVDKPEFEFESAQAADSHVKAYWQTRLAEDQDAEAQNNLAMQKQSIDALNRAFGLPGPSVQIAGDMNSHDMDAQASGAMRTAAKQNAGTVGRVTVVNDPTHEAGHGVDAYYPPTQAQLQQNPNAFLDLVNADRSINGQPTLSVQDWKTGAGTIVPDPRNAINSISDQAKWQRAQVADAYQNIYGLPQITGKTPDAVRSAGASEIAHQQQLLTNYQNRPNAVPQVVAALKTRLQSTRDMVSAMQNGLSQLEAQNIAARSAAELRTPQGRAALQKSIQDTIDAKYKNLQSHQDELLKNGRDPETGETLNLGNAPDEMLIDPATHQPVPTSMIQTIKPTMQERNRADFAESTLHSLNEIDKLRMAGKLPNGPLQGLSTKALVKAGMANGDAQKAMDFISFAQSAATGAHVGGRFNEVIMQKMHDMIGLNMNDSQFSGAEDAIRSVMQQYAEHGGIETVGQYRNGLIGSVKFLPNGQRFKVTGFDKSGNVTGTVVR